MSGEITYTLYEDVLLVEKPFPPAADAFFVANYLFYAAALLLLARRRTLGRDWKGITDAAIITTGAAVLSWVFLMNPYAGDLTLSLLERLLSISYPLMDLLLLALAARLAVAPGARAGVLLIVASLVLYLVSDSIYVLLELADPTRLDIPSTRATCSPTCCSGPLRCILSIPTLSEPGSWPSTKLTWRRIALLAIAPLAAPGVLAVEAARAEPIEAPVIVGGSVILFLIVLARLAGFVCGHECAVAREKILREAGVALVKALNREDINAVALEASTELMRDRLGSGSYIATGLGEDLILFASASGAGAGAGGSSVDLSELPDSVYASLLAGRSVTLRDTETAALRGILDGEPETILVCSLAGGEGPGGASRWPRARGFPKSSRRLFRLWAPRYRSHWRASPSPRTCTGGAGARRA